MPANSSADQINNDERERVLDIVLGPASEAYYSDRVRSGSEARVRAQSAQSTVTLFASGIVAALTFTQLAGTTLLTRCAGVSAVALWLTAAVLYLRAVAQPVSAVAGPAHAQDRRDLLGKLLQRADAEAAQVDRRQRHANGVVIAALIASVVTVALAALLGPAKDTAPGALVVSPEYANSVKPLCEAAGHRITGKIDKASLSSAFIRISVSGDACGKNKGPQELAVPKKDVRAIVLKGDR
ncbi:hypothetical protein ACH4KO_30640 [Streptomyces anulatus]